MKNELRPGETVDLLIPDVLVNHGSGENGNLSVKLADETWLFIPTAMARVTRRVPADGVPQPGDVWRDRFGGVWFARDAGVFVSQENRPFCTWQGVNQDCGPIELLYRPGDDSTPPPSAASAVDAPAPAAGEEVAVGVAASAATSGAPEFVPGPVEEPHEVDMGYVIVGGPALETGPAALDGLGVAVTGADDLVERMEEMRRVLHGKPDAGGDLIAPAWVDKDALADGAGTAEELT